MQEAVNKETILSFIQHLHHIHQQVLFVVLAVVVAVALLLPGLVMLVVDLADPDWSSQLATVHRLLDSLGSESLRCVVANQIDRCPLDAIDDIRRDHPQALFLSAKRGDGLRGLQDWLRDQFFDPSAESSQELDGLSPGWPS